VTTATTGSGRRPRAAATEGGPKRVPARPASRAKVSRATTDRSAKGTITVRLFDADRTDQTLDLEAALRRRLTKRQLLWIDVEGTPRSDAVAAIARRMKLKPITQRELEASPDRPQVALHGSYFHIRVATEADHDPSESPRWLDLIAAGEIVLSSHTEPIEFLQHLDDRIEADTTVGQIDAAAFVASSLDAAVTSYFQAVDAIEEAVDQLDARALIAPAGEDILGELVALRRRIARLRRVLTGEREVFAAFAAPDFGVATPGQDSGPFQAVSARFESALQSVEDSRDVLLGSFEVFMTRTAQRTNEVMKVLALATVLLLPGSLVAGLLGMNVSIPLAKDDPLSFWLVVTAIVALAAGVLVFARIRRWI
jgi:Mg2+ and Co2+ transporter CorA